VISQAVAELAPLLPVKAACELAGQPRSTLYRQRNPRPQAERQPPQAARHPAALSPAERAQLLGVLDSDRFADKSPAQAWAILLDEGAYLASVSTMYRVLRAEGQVRERRAQAAHPPRVRPELVATGPSQVWSWDITKLKGPWRGIWFDLYVMLDIFSRKAIWQEVHATENGDLAKEFITNAIAANGGIAPGGVHADNGTSMTSKTVTGLLSDLKISRSHSRPHVSNDNPYSEAQFKTLKYCPAFPGSFETLHQARDFCDVFFGYYNTQHRHSGIGLHTPASVHDGTAWAIQARRQQTLDHAYAASPIRFQGKRPQAPRLPAKVWINQPRAAIETQEAPQTNPAA
jgi:transposase InsO family protein